MNKKTRLTSWIVSSYMLMVVFAGGGMTAVGQEAASAREGAEASSTSPLLGSSRFYPTPERPLGWRGDWTGRFPGATPPTQWSRRVQGLTSTIKYQAEKPSGAPSGASHSLEYFTIKEWLVTGPFSVIDPEKDIEKDFLGGEENARPARGAKAGESTWKRLRVGIDTQSCHYHNEGTCGDLNVDFVYVYGNLPESGRVETLDVSLNNKVAYGHTYFHSLVAGEVMLRVNYAAAAIKVRLNGSAVPIQRRQAVRSSLKQGWNRLLVKAASGEATAPAGQNPWVSRWRFAVYLEPVPPVSYQTRNIAWMTKMTGRSMSAPIIVGDRVLIGSGMTDLLCLDKKSGKIMWQRSNTPYDAMTDAEKTASAKVKEKIEPLMAKLDALNREAVDEINAAVSQVGLSSDRRTELDKTLKAKADAERAVHDAFARIDRRQYPPMYRNEVSSSNAVPLSDGRFVYWVAGGGMKGPGSYVIACFDLSGKRIWSWHDKGLLGAPEHGNHISMNLVEGRLIYSANGTLLALDAKTGKELWRNHPDDWQNIGHGSHSPLIVKLGNQNAIVQHRYIHRVTDGTVICPSNLELWGVLTPIVQNGVIFNPCRWRGFKAPVSFIGVKPPAAAGPGAKTETVVDLAGKDVTMLLRAEGPNFMVASPLWVDDVVYSVEMGGGLAAVDTVAGKAHYRQYLDGYNRYNRFTYGVAASPTLAGANIYITDDAGYTHIIRPGPRLVEAGRNVIENIHFSGLGGNPCKQESFYTSPFFEGERMYLRGEEYLYCIGSE